MIKLIAKFTLWIIGWSVDENIPKESDKSVVIAAPHTSNWDGIIMRIAFAQLGVPFKFAIKNDFTKFPYGLLVKPLGGLGIDRSPKKEGKSRPSQIDQMAAFFETHERLALAIAPEGTRSYREQWKKGFYHIAKLANVPITFGYLDYDKKVAGIGGVLYPSDDETADMKKVMAFYKDIAPKHKDKYSLDKRYS